MVGREGLAYQYRSNSFCNKVILLQLPIYYNGDNIYFYYNVSILGGVVYDNLWTRL